MLFNESRYQKEEPKGNSLRNVAYAAAAAVGLVTAAPVIAKAGKDLLEKQVSKKILNAIGANAAEISQTAEAAVIGAQGNTAILQENLLGEAANTIINSNVRTKVWTGLTKTAKHEGFRGYLSGIVDGEGQRAFSDQFIDEATAQLDDVFSFDSARQAQQSLNSPRTAERLQVLHEAYTKQAAASARVDQSTFKAQMTMGVVSGFSSPVESYHDVVKSSAGTIGEMQKKLVEAAAKRDEFGKLLSDPGGTEYTFGDLFNMDEIRKKGANLANQVAQKSPDLVPLEKFLTAEGKRVQERISHTTGGKNKTFLSDTLSDFLRNQSKMLEGGKGGIDLGSEAANVFAKSLDLFEATKTGLVNMSQVTGKERGFLKSPAAKELFPNASRRHTLPFMGADSGVVSQAFVAKQIRDSASKLGQEFTIPLLPGLFNIKASKLFGFLKSDNVGIKDLGYLSRQTEIEGASFGEYGLSAGSTVFGLKGSELRKVSDKPYRFLATGESDVTKRALRDRNQLKDDSSGFLGLTDFESDWKDVGPVGAIRNLLKGPGDQNTKARQAFYSKQDVMYDIAEDKSTPGHVILTPKKGFEGVGGALLQAVNGSPSVPLQHVNKLGLQMLEQQDLSADMKMKLAGHLASQAASTPEMIEKDVQSIFAGANFAGSDKYFVRGIEEVVASPTPDSRWMKMLEEGWFDIRSGSDVGEDQLEIMRNSGGLYKAVDYAQGDKTRFTSIGTSNEGKIPSALEGIFGSELSSKMARDLTSALLEEGSQKLGFSKVQKILGDRDISEALGDKAVGFTATTKEFDQIDVLFAQMLGLTEESNEVMAFGLSRLYTSLRVGPGASDVRELNIGSVKQLMGLVGGDEILRSGGVSDVTKAKLVENMTSTLGAFKFIQTDPAPRAVLTGATRAQSELEKSVGEAVSNRALSLAGEGSVGRVINKRFGFGGKIPDPPTIDVTDLTASLDYYAVGGMEEGKMGDYIMGSLKAMFDPKAQQTAFSHGANALLTSSNTMLESLGLALRPSDTQTVQSFIAGMALKRALPAIVGYELYKNFNDDAETYGIPGIDDLYANARARVGLGVRGVLDKLGITGSAKEFARRHPGLDRYLNPSSQEEYQEYLLHGYDPIRRGRFLALGNKGQFMGGDVEYFRANFYKRGKSGWEGADNVQWASAETSFLPTLTNPLAPLTRFLSPSWEERVREERPYIPGEEPQYGQGDGSGQLGGSNIFRTNAQNYSNMTGYFGGYRDSAVYAEVSDAQMSAIAGQGEGDYYGGMGGGPGVSTQRITTYLDKQTRPASLSSGIGDDLISAIERYRDQSGLYGGLLKAISFGSGKNFYDIPTQSSSSARDIRRFIYANRMGELTGEGGEAIRRLLGFPDKDEDAFSPYRNNMPQWLVESDEMLGWGDIYTRRPNGEQLLPGDAFERMNQYVRPNKVDVDLLGETDADIMESMIDPVGYHKRIIFDSEEAKAAKMEALKVLQMQGVLGGTNVAVYNVEHNYSSTVDALAGSTPIKIVTVDSMGFQNRRAGYAAEESLQLEMAAMGVGQGGMMFVNYEDPSQTYLQMVSFNQGMMNKALGRIESARDQLGALREARMLSPYETYDPLARLQVLARTAPNSRQTKELERYFASSVALGGYERIIYQNIKRDLDLVRRDFDFHFDKGSFKTRPVYSMVNYVSEDGQIVTDSGVYRVGGIEWEPELLESGMVSNILAQYGIEAGKRAFFTTNESALDPDFMGQNVFSADFRILGDSVSQNLVQAGYARESVSSDPISRRALGQSGGGLWEDFVHMDFLLQNKFLRVRTPSEQLERGDVYGSDYMDWRNLGSTLVGPTISNWASKSPLHAAALAGSVGYIAFGVSKQGKGKAGAIFAAIGAAASVARGLYETVTGKKWKPGRTRRKDEFEDYYDALQYVKYSRLAEHYKDQAFLKAGENVDLMNRQPERFKRRVSKWSMLAIEAERKAKATRLGFDLANGTLDEMVATISEGRRQAVKEAALYGDRGEKKKVFDLLSKSEQMVASRFLLGKQRTMVSATDIFMNAYLPDDNWAGWNEDVDIRDIKTRARLAENIKSRPISEKEIRQARNNTMGVPLPNMDFSNRTPLLMKAKLDNLMLGIGLKNQNVNARLTNPAVPPSEIDVSGNIKENETPALSSYIKERAY